MANYGSWAVIKLKSELRRRGAVTTGRKNDLVGRLESYDRNNNFYTVVAADVSVPAMPDWPSSGFRQLTAQMRSEIPSVTQNLIFQYFSTHTECDSQQSGDIQALKKGRLLLESKKVDVCSMLFGEKVVFFSGIVKAAMKKKISYNVRLTVDNITGDVLNSDCECPCGKGPHGTCKHLSAFMYMLETLRRTGTLLCNKSCTDTLQTFHQPRQLYDGSPLKVSLLQKQTGTKISGDDDDDPRPLSYRNWGGYNDYVKNTVTNYCAQSGKDLAYRYLQPKADVQAAMIDHSYTELPFAEYWVDESNRVTSATVSDIEKQTRGQSQSHKWFQQRSWRLTASKFGDVLKATSRRNLSKLYQIITSPLLLNTPAVCHGRKYEKTAIDVFSAIAGISVEKCGLFVSEEWSFLAASPDGLVGDSAVVEVKCPFRGFGQLIEANKLFPFLYSDRTDKKMHLKPYSKYWLQVQGQMAVTGRQACLFIVYTRVDLFVEKITFDQQYWLTVMLPQLQHFYERHLRPYVAQHM